MIAFKGLVLIDTGFYMAFALEIGLPYYLNIFIDFFVFRF